VVGYSAQYSDGRVSGYSSLENFSALVDAILERDMAPTVQLLLNAGADVNLQGGVYGCPLAVSLLIHAARFTYKIEYPSYHLYRLLCT
jgi:hypothetical protein